MILPFNEVEKMPAHSPHDHYEMSHETRNALTLSTWLGDNEDDPALTVMPFYLACFYLLVDQGANYFI